MDKKLFLPLSLGFICVTAFSLTPLATKVAVKDVTPLMATSLRVVIGSIFCLIYLFASRAKFPSLNELKHLLLIALIGMFGFAVLLALGVQTAPASHAAVTMAVTPLLTAIGTTVIMREPTTKLFWISAVTGTALTILYMAKHAAGHLALGDIYLIASAIAAAYGYVMGTSLARKKGGPWVTSWVVVLGSPAFFLYITINGLPSMSSMHFDSLMGLLYLGIISQSLGMFLWYRCLSSGYASLIAQSQTFQPFISLIFATILLGETVSSDLWLTCVGVAACFAVATYARMYLTKKHTIPAQGCTARAG